MSKSEYSDYILKSVGSSNDVTHLANNCSKSSFTKQKPIVNKCFICGKGCKQKQKLYTLHICNHQFHHKCINKLYKEKSSIGANAELLSCPMCNSSTEELCTLIL